MDNILNNYLRRQEKEGHALAAASDIFSLSPVAGEPPWRYRLHLDCRGLVRVDGRIEEAGHFEVGLTFGPDHLRVSPGTPEVLALLQPESIFNANARFPFICIGEIKPGTGIVEIAHRVFEVLTYQRFTLLEWDALNADACAWSRNNMARFPIDSRPLRRPPPLPLADPGEARA